jgi:hypothetical protein
VITASSALVSLVPHLGGGEGAGFNAPPDTLSNLTRVKVSHAAGRTASVVTIEEALEPLIPPPLTAVRNRPFGTLIVTRAPGKKLSRSLSHSAMAVASVWIGAEPSLGPPTPPPLTAVR